MFAFHSIYIPLLLHFVVFAFHFVALLGVCAQSHFQATLQGSNYSYTAFLGLLLSLRADVNVRFEFNNSIYRLLSFRVCVHRPFFVLSSSILRAFIVHSSCIHRPFFMYSSFVFCAFFKRSPFVHRLFSIRFALTFAFKRNGTGTFMTSIVGANDINSNK